MLQLPNITNRFMLFFWAAMTMVIGFGQLGKGSPVETVLGWLFLMTSAFLFSAGIWKRVMMVFTGFSIATIAFITRAILGQLIPDIAFASRFIVAATWLLLAWCAFERATRAKHVLNEQGLNID